jgi:Trypsin-like peptidase domain
MPPARGLIVAMLLLPLSACAKPQVPVAVARPTSSAYTHTQPGPAWPVKRARHAPARPQDWPQEPAVQQVAVAATPAPVWSEVVMRLEFALPEKGLLAEGTGFVVQDRAGDCYLLTCAHLLAHEEWRRRATMAMRTMNGKRSIESWALSVHVGKSADVHQADPDGQPDLTRDLVIHPVLGTWPKPLPLAAADPPVGECVWAVGREALAPPGDEQLYRGRIVEVAGGCYLLEKDADFDPHGFSGGPVVNARGEVVGNVVAGGGNRIGGATVTTLRRRLREQGITVD